MSNVPAESITPSVAVVYLNNIAIGSLPISEHQQLLAEAKRDPWLYLYQLRNTVWVIFRVLGKIFELIPFIFTTLLFLLVLCAPASKLGLALQDVASKFAATPPQALGEYIGSIFVVLLCISWLVVTIALVAFGARPFGHRDVFKEQANFQLRKRLKVAAEGDVSVLYLPAYMAVASNGQEANLSSATSTTAEV